MANFIKWNRGVKFLKTSLALIAKIFYLDAKTEEKLKKNLKISFALLESLLPDAGEWNFTPLWNGNLTGYALVYVFEI